MKLQLATLALSLRYIPNSQVSAQTCSGTTGPFTLTELTGTCNYAKLLDEYTRQVFDMTGSTCMEGSTVTAKEDLDAKLMGAVAGSTSGEEAAEVVCKALYDNADVTAFVEAAGKSEDPANLHFEQEFYNGRGPWQEEVETLYEAADGSATSVLRQDAARVREFYVGLGSYSQVQWPNALTNFEDSTCTSKAAMCCWPKDRQANDGNGNCATPYDVNCVDKDPADNTNLCFADLAKGDATSELNSSDGFMVFPGDNNNGEGAIHCHGFAWADDDYDPISRYKANNLFFVSMYDHMHQRGYVKNIPGMPMCGCMDQMPIATRSDCTQVDVTEDWEMVYDGTSFTGKMVKVEVDFNACRGRNNRNNDLWAYAARLYDEGRMTAAQFGKVGRVLTNDHDCYHAVEYAKQQKGLTTGYTHQDGMYTKVAGRDNMHSGEPHGREAFNKAFFEQTLTKPSVVDIAEGSTYAENETPIIMRICPDCRKTHRKIWYRRLTPVRDANFDLLHNILYYRSDTPPVGNRWNVDFTLHSSYEDAKTGANPWQCPNNQFNYNDPFTGRCSPSGERVDNQYSKWDWYPGPRPNVAYYINKPEASGVRDYMDYLPAQRASEGGITDIDIGEPDAGLAGNTWEDNGVFHMTGAGEDIWWYRDQFHYKSKPWSGDIDVSVRITDFANNGNHGWAKAGLMLRSDNSDDATFAFSLLSGHHGITTHVRRSKGKHAEHFDGSRYDLDQTNAWLRIVKKLETIEFYYGSNDGTADTPGTWILQETQTILFPDDSYRVGFAVTSNQRNYLAEATFDNYVIEEYVFPTSAPSLSSAPTPWMPLVDIGEPQQAGEFYSSQDGLIDYVKGSGTGIWGSSDSFAFYNHQLPNAPLTVTMYIKHFDNSNINSRGGLMIRDSNDADAANAFVGAAGNDQGAVFQSRASAGAATDHHKMIYANWNNAMWVKMTMDATGVVTGYYKLLEADEWIELGSTQLNLTGSTIQVGRAITSGTDYQWAKHTVETQHFDVSQ